MLLVKSPTLTPALLAAKRRNAQKSTGPRTVRGKAYSRTNGLRHGGRSPAYRQLWTALGNARPGAIDRTAQTLLPPELARHPLFSEVVDLFRWAEKTSAGERALLPGGRAPKATTSRSIRGPALRPLPRRTGMRSQRPPGRA